MHDQQMFMYIQLEFQQILLQIIYLKFLCKYMLFTKLECIDLKFIVDFVTYLS